MSSRIQPVLSVNTITDYSKINIEQPESITQSMKLHQLATLQRCRELEEDDFVALEEGENQIRTRFGIIGDKVGSGKSLVILSLIVSQLQLKMKRGFHTVKDTQLLTEIIWKGPPACEILPLNVIVIPHGIQKQWKTYAERDIDSKKVRVKCIFRENIASELTEDKMESFLKSYDILIITATMFKNFHDQFYKYSDFRLRQNPDALPLFVSRFIIDEADAIQITGQRRLDAAFYWFVTSSVHNLLNPNGITKYDQSSGYMRRTIEGGIKHTGFVHNTFHHLQMTDQRLHLILLKNDDAVVDASFGLEDVQMTTLKCKSPQIISIITGLVPDEIMNLVSSGNVEDAIAKINCEKTDELNLVNVLTRKYAQEMENMKIEFEMKSKMNFVSSKQKQHTLEKVQKRIDEMQKKIDTIRDRVASSMQDECLYCCTDKIERPTIARCCQKVYCFECITSWLSDHVTCPNCASTCGVHDLVILANGPVVPMTNDIVELQEGHLTKIETIAKILEGNRNGKFLIFAAWDNSFHVVMTELTRLEKRFRLLKGSGAQIQAIMNDYKKKDDGLDVLLLNSTFFGNGLNLENTTDIIIFHKMDKEMEKQVIGRGQRFGRVGALRVWKLEYEND